MLRLPGSAHKVTDWKGGYLHTFAEFCLERETDEERMDLWHLRIIHTALRNIITNFLLPYGLSGVSRRTEGYHVIVTPRGQR